MTTNRPSPSRKPRSATYGVPISSLLLALAVLTGSLLHFAVAGQDDTAREASKTIARGAFGSERQSLEDVVRNYAAWNAVVENLLVDLDRAWARYNLGRLAENYRAGRIFVVDAQHRPVYGMLGGESVASDNRAWRQPDFLELLSRARPVGRGEPASAYVAFRDGIHLTAVSALVERGGGARGFLAVTRKIDQTLVDEIEASFQLPELDLLVDAAPDESSAALPLTGPAGEATAYLTWTPPRPGTRLLEWLAAPLGLGFALVGGAIGVIIVRARRTNLALQEAFEARVAAQQRLEYLARHDSLTGLPNRELFLEHLTTAIAQTRRYGSGFAIHYLDLDGFKRVNDTFGHPAGDDLLRAIAARLNDAMRAADTIARFGGDEFAVLQRSVDDGNEAHRLAQRLIQAVKQPVEIAGDDARITLSVGIALDADAQDPEQIIRKADRALYRAKRQGGDRLEVYDAALDERKLTQPLAPMRDKGVVTKAQ